MKSKFLIAILLLMSCVGKQVNAQENLADNFSDKKITLNGYIRAGVFGGEKEMRDYYSEGALKLNVPIGNKVSGFSEIRYRVNKQNENNINIREAYINLNLGKFDIRAGEQIILWGRADGFNPTNNITPQDFSVFSPEEDDRRLGNFVVQTVFNPYPFRVELDWVPVYKSSLFPFVGKPMGDNINWKSKKSSSSWKDQSFGLKIDLEKADFDLSVSYYNGLHKYPGIVYQQMQNAILLEQKPYRVQVIGADFSTSLSSYGLRGELAWTMPETVADNIFYIPKSQLEYTIGIDKDWSNFSLIVQYIGKYIPDLKTLDAPKMTMGSKIASMNQIIFAQHEKWNHSISIRPALNLLHETFKLEFLGLCEFSTDEYFFQPKASYNIVDAVTASVGAQLFYGPDDRLFGILEKNKNALFAELKISF